MFLRSLYFTQHYSYTTVFNNILFFYHILVLIDLFKYNIFIV